MGILKDSDAIRYNTDNYEINRIKYGRGLHRHQDARIQGDGIREILHSAGSWVAKNPQAISGLADAAGSIAKNVINTIKEVEDLKRIQALKQATEELREQRSKATTKDIKDGRGAIPPIFTRLAKEAAAISNKK